MKRIRKDIEISNLIYKSLRGETSKDEDELLEAWCLESRNRKLFLEFQEADHLYEGITDMYNVDTNVPLKKVNDKIKKKKHVRVLKYISGIAAVLLVGVIFMLSMEDKTEPTRQVLLSSVSKERMEPFATLVTTTGKVVYLEDSVKQESLKASNKESLKQEESGNGEVLPQEIKQEVEYNVLTTSKQGNIKVVLYDGSHVWLNAGSELRYPNSFVENQRVVYLKGEAYFEVKRDTLRSFVVHTPYSNTKVLGTSFNVSAYEDETTTAITLVSGKVEVYNQHEKCILKPGWQAVTENKSGTLKTREVDVTGYVSWKDGMFEFNDMPLEQLVSQLSRWYDVDFFFANSDIRDFKFTGAIKRSNTLLFMLEFIEKTSNVYFKVNGNVIQIYEK